MSASQYAFNQAFSSISTSVEFSDSWSNGTGYLDNAVHHGPQLAVGEQVKSETANGRRIVITGTPVGNVIVFERYSPTDGERSPVIVYNAPDCVRSLLGGTSLNEGQVLLALGHHGVMNIGQTVARLIDVARKISA